MDITSYLLGKNSSGGGGGGEKIIPIISPEEIVVGTWLDKRPLYMKTITSTQTSSSSGSIPGTDVDINVSENIDVLFLGENSYFMDTNLKSYPANYVNATSGSSAIGIIKTFVSPANKNISFEAYNNAFPVNDTISCVFNVFYVKTGDNPLDDVSSVGWLHYSTTEHTVGELPSGDIVYEKTIQASTSYGGYTSVDRSIAHNIANVKNIWICDGSFFYRQGSITNRSVNFANYGTNVYRQQAQATANATDIHLFVGSWIESSGTIAHFVTIRYTKQTA